MRKADTRVWIDKSITCFLEALFFCELMMMTMMMMMMVVLIGVAMGQGVEIGAELVLSSR